MNIQLSKSSAIAPKDTVTLLTNKKAKFDFKLEKKELDFIYKEIEHDKKVILINRFDQYIFVCVLKEEKTETAYLESARKTGAELNLKLNEAKLKSTFIISEENKDLILAFTEGITLANYQFLKYVSKKSKVENTLKKLQVISKNVNQKDIDELNILVDSTCIARDLVNEPLSYLTAEQLSEEIRSLGKKAGIKVEILNETKIQSLKMGGLLAVNKGSQDPPTFSIMEWKPKNAKNKKPIVFVGKGIVYDTGGLSLKPTPNSMDMMKCDMAGAAAVIGAIYAIASAKLPIHVVGLIPATDNRPGENAYVPGDVITLHNGKTVEVLNTDAEGRLVLGDALSYAQKYKPELVIDLATLTGAAVAAIGTFGIVSMGTATLAEKHNLQKSGEKVYERLAEMPFWDEYAELIKSDIADIKNIGGPHGGAITAGKFLEHFTDYPWMHLDIAGPAFLTVKDGYRGKGGTGVGVRLLYDFIKNKAGK